MGKVKKVTMDAAQEAEVQEKKASKKKTMTIWEDLYTDLSPAVATALREARVKPEQLATMADGEIMAISGMTDAGLEQIRSIYMADINASSAGSELSTVKSEAEDSLESHAEEPGVIPPNKRHDFKNGKAIQAAKSKVDRTKLYSIEEAVKLVKATNITKFDSTVTLHINLNPKEKLTRAEVTFPHMAGSAKRVAIVSDALLADIESGKIEFDILITSPAFMPKLAKYARVLGPKGLMPNPKNGTVAADPEAKAKEFAAGKTVIKAEPKFPLMHVTVGKVSQPEAELVANIQAALDAVKAKNMVKATLASTMSPGIKVQF
jgi:large subunit ribosomal protein L1